MPDQSTTLPAWAILESTGTVGAGTFMIVDPHIPFEASIGDVLDSYISDQRLKDALFGQGVIGTWGGPYDHGTASIKLMHYQGDLEGQGPVWGYVEGGMGMVSFAIADAAQEAGATLACGVPVGRIIPGEGVEADDGTIGDGIAMLAPGDPGFDEWDRWLARMRPLSARRATLRSPERSEAPRGLGEGQTRRISCPQYARAPPRDDETARAMGGFAHRGARIRTGDLKHPKLAR